MGNRDEELSMGPVTRDGSAAGARRCEGERREEERSAECRLARN